VFFNAPTISAGDKKAVLKTVFQGKICEELLNLLYILVDKGRSPHYEKIYKAYRKIVNQAEGFSCGHVYSAAPLNTTQIETLEAQTGKLMGKTVRLKNETDASLIGGVKVLIDGKIFDASIRKRLEDLEKTMK
ncbi:MAG: ATP synthase F1 subunit delta, partial [Bacteroidales bacterium]